jgi:transposase InsO family protein
LDVILTQDEPEIKIVHARRMNTYMNDTKLLELNKVREFVKASVVINFIPASQTESYEWIAGTLKRFNYFKLSKKDRGTVRAYLKKRTGYSRAQLNRLIKQYRKKRWIGVKSRNRNCFAKLYKREDISLLAETDECHQTLSGPATKKLFERGYGIFKDSRYARLANISVAHIYNLRKCDIYREKRRNFTKTKKSVVAIGERRKPRPNGAPGYLRIDTVHQGDQDGAKGVYYINAVDEVTQMEVICAVEKISENYLIPVLEQMIEYFPFEIKEIHADNGSEYINHTVAKLLNKLLIELTKSRSRQTNDNALVESKNGSIIRKWLGYCYIPQKHAPVINEFFKKYFIPYINYHRPCHYPVIIVDEKTGKQHKKYPYDNMMTPYEKFKSLPKAEQYLKSGISFSELDALAKNETDLEAARKVKQAREKMFQIFDKAQ